MTSQKRLDFIDLKSQQQRISDRLNLNLQRVLAHGQYIMGPEVNELETRLAAYVGVRHAISCSSGTDALLMPLMAHGVGPGDAIFTTPFTFIATAEVIQLLGATPVFVDIDPQTFNLDPDSLAEAVGSLGQNPGTAHLQPKGVIPVDLFGQPADYDRINAIARDHGLFVLEDAAQSFGATYKGRRAGALAEMAATSFFPAKPLGCYGDGGAIFTDDDGLAEVLRSIRVHGQGKDKYENVRIGLNGRLDTLQAAVLLAKLEIFDQEVVDRQRVARQYCEALRRLVRCPRWPRIAPRSGPSIRCSATIGSFCCRNCRRPKSPPPSIIPCPYTSKSAFAHLGYKPGDFPVSEHASRRIFSLPMHPYLGPADQERIVQALFT